MAEAVALGSFLSLALLLVSSMRWRATHTTVAPLISDSSPTPSSQHSGVEVLCIYAIISWEIVFPRSHCFVDSELVPEVSISASGAHGMVIEST